MTLMLLNCWLWVKSQDIPPPPIPIELLQGNQKFYSLLVVDRSVSPVLPINYFNITTFSANNQNEVSHNEFFSSSLISYPLYGDFRITSGINLNSVVGLNYFAGFQFSKLAGSWLIVVVPGVYFQGGSSFETLALVEYCPPISQQLKLYTRVHVMHNANLTDWKHNSSFDYLRLGITAKSITMGVGLNADWYGPSRILEKNYGVFIRAELH